MARFDDCVDEIMECEARIRGASKVLADAYLDGLAAGRDVEANDLRGRLKNLARRYISS